MIKNRKQINSLKWFPIQPPKTTVGKVFVLLFILSLIILSILSGAILAALTLTILMVFNLWWYTRKDYPILAKLPLWVILLMFIAVIMFGIWKYQIYQI